MSVSSPQCLLPERTSAISEACTDLATPLASVAHLFARTVEIYPIDGVKRHSTSVVWDTATKLRDVITNGQADKSYVDALTNVLAHELLRSEKEMSKNFPVSRGGLATWQMRAVARHIEERLSEKIPLVTLAKLTRLS